VIASVKIVITAASDKTGNAGQWRIEKWRLDQRSVRSDTFRVGCKRTKWRT